LLYGKISPAARCPTHGMSLKINWMIIAKKDEKKRMKLFTGVKEG